jgi:hypothetical protein|tara:strand:- start:5838 stop:6074 length:237 start_codon:yes stop_codon:yes gene_type:complete
MFHPTLDPKGLSDSELESRIKDVTIKLNQALKMNNKNFYDQLLAINNTLQLESETRKLDKKNNDPDADTQFDNLINVK